MTCEYCTKFEKNEYLHCLQCGAALEPTDEEEQLSDFLTKKTRNKLVNALLIEHENSDLASRLGVTVRTVNRWASNGIQACNLNADKILKQCYETCPDRTREILEESLETFRHLTALSTPRHGDVLQDLPVLKEVVN